MDHLMGLERAAYIQGLCNNFAAQASGLSRKGHVPKKTPLQLRNEAYERYHELKLRHDPMEPPSEHAPPLRKSKTLAEMGIKTNFDEDWSSYPKAEKPKLEWVLRLMVERNLNPNIKVLVGGQVFTCHLQVLQAYCKDFRSFKNESWTRVLDPTLTTSAFIMAYQWMMAEWPIIQREAILEVYNASIVLKMDALANHCWAIFNDPNFFTEDKAFMMFVESQIYKMSDLQSIMLSRISKFFLTVVASTEFIEMEADHVSLLLQQNCLAVNSETEIFMAAVRWINYKWDERWQYGGYIMKRVRFTLLPPWFLTFLSKDRGGCMEIDRVLELSEVRRLMNDGTAFNTALMYFGGTTETYRSLMATYKKHISMPRTWIYDKNCLYHIKPDGKPSAFISYSGFLEYLYFLQYAPKYYYKSFINIDALYYTLDISVRLDPRLMQTQQIGRLGRASQEGLIERYATGDTQPETRQTGSQKTKTKQNKKKRNGKKQNEKKRAGKKQNGKKQNVPTQTGPQQTETQQTGTQKTETQQNGVQETGTQQTGTKQTETKQTEIKQAATHQTGTKQAATTKDENKPTETKQIDSQQTKTQQTGTPHTGPKQTETKQNNQTENKKTNTKPSGIKQTKSKETEIKDTDTETETETEPESMTAVSNDETSLSISHSVRFRIHKKFLKYPPYNFKRTNVTVGSFPQPAETKQSSKAATDPTVQKVPTPSSSNTTISLSPEQASSSLSVTKQLQAITFMGDGSTTTDVQQHGENHHQDVGEVRAQPHNHHCSMHALPDNFSTFRKPLILSNPKIMHQHHQHHLPHHCPHVNQPYSLCQIADSQKSQQELPSHQSSVQQMQHKCHLHSPTSDWKLEEPMECPHHRCISPCLQQQHVQRHDTQQTERNQQKGDYHPKQTLERPHFYHQHRHRCRSPCQHDHHWPSSYETQYMLPEQNHCLHQIQHPHQCHQHRDGHQCKHEEIFKGNALYPPSQGCQHKTVAQPLPSILKHNRMENNAIGHPSQSDMRTQCAAVGHLPQTLSIQPTKPHQHVHFATNLEEKSSNISTPTSVASKSSASNTSSTNANNLSVHLDMEKKNRRIQWRFNDSQSDDSTSRSGKSGSTCDIDAPIGSSRGEISQRVNSISSKSSSMVHLSSTSDSSLEPRVIESVTLPDCSRRLSKTSLVCSLHSDDARGNIYMRSSTKRNVQYANPHEVDSCKNSLTTSGASIRSDRSGSTNQSGPNEKCEPTKKTASMERNSSSEDCGSSKGSEPDKEPQLTLQGRFLKYRSSSEMSGFSKPSGLGKESLLTVQSGGTMSSSSSEDGGSSKGSEPDKEPQLALQSGFLKCRSSSEKSGFSKSSAMGKEPELTLQSGCAKCSSSSEDGGSSKASGPGKEPQLALQSGFLKCRSSSEKSGFSKSSGLGKESLLTLQSGCAKCSSSSEDGGSSKQNGLTMSCESTKDSVSGYETRPNTPMCGRDRNVNLNLFGNVASCAIHPPPMARKQRIASAASAYFNLLSGPKIVVIGGIDPYLWVSMNASHGDAETSLGYDHRGNSSNGDQVLFLDILAGQWRHLTYIPFGYRHHHATVFCNGLIYIIGGVRTSFRDKTTVIEKSIWSFDTQTLRWELEGSLPQGRRDFTAIVIEDTGSHESYCRNRLGVGFFIIGGQCRDGRATDSVLFFNVITKSWINKPPLKYPRFGHMAIRLGNQIWVGGGMIDMKGQAQVQPSDHSQHNKITDSMEYYNLTCDGAGSRQYVPDEWTLSAVTLRNPMVFGKFLTMSDDKMYSVGGLTINGKGDYVSTTAIDRFETGLNEWRHVGDLVQPRHGHDVGKFDDRILALGGVNGIEKRTINSVELYDVKNGQNSYEIPDLPWPISGCGIICLN